MPAALFALAISLRLIYLSADPPSWIRLSMAMETDPPVYTVYTRSDILTGGLDSYDDYRLKNSGNTRCAATPFRIIYRSFFEVKLTAICI